MRDDALYLDDIVEAVEAIRGFLAGVDRAAFLASDLVRSAVLQKLTIIGEAAARLSDGFKSRHPGIEWARIADFRNYAVHVYFAVRWERVWNAATVDAPNLGAAVARILAEEFPPIED